MNDLDWQMLFFVSTSIVHEYWVLWGLPRVYVWNFKHEDENQTVQFQESKSNAS